MPFPRSAAIRAPTRLVGDPSWPFRFDKLTIKAQEAVQARSRAGRRPRQPADRRRCTCWRALLAEQRGHRARRCSSRSASIAGSWTGSSRPSWAIFPRSPAARSRSPTRSCIKVLEAAPARGRRDEGRVRLHRAPAAGPDQGRLQGQERPEAQRHQRQGACSRRCRRSAAAPGSPTRTRRTSSRPWSATASTWWSGPGRASSTR